MSKTGRDGTERVRYWLGLVDAWSGSGLSQAEFCRRRGVNGVTFAWWKRPLRRESGVRCTNHTPVKWMDEGRAERGVQGAGRIQLRSGAVDGGAKSA